MKPLADDLADGSDQGACCKHTGALACDSRYVRDGQRRGLSGTSPSGLSATWGDNDDVGAEVFEFTLDQFAGACADRDHGGDCGDSDDDPEDGQTGPQLVLAKCCDGDSKDVCKRHRLGGLKSSDYKAWPRRVGSLLNISW